MSTTTRRLRVLAVAAATLATLTTAACGPSVATKPGAAPRTTAAYDAALHEQLPDSVKSAGVIRVGTDASYAPMSFFAPDGRTIIGVEPDLGAAIGKVLGVRLDFQVHDFTTLLPKVRSGRLDVALAAMTDTPDREKQADFVNYFDAGTSILVQRGNPAGITDMTDLCGKVVAVEKGTTQADMMQRAQKNCGAQPVQLKTYDTNSDALLQLRTGRAAAVLNDFPPASYLVSDPRTRAHYQLASTAQYEPGLYGMAVSKEQQGLRDALQGALEDLQRSGAYGAVLTQWHVAPGGVTEVTVNSGR
jgi:polar amino acid transport system substrate-binding protein